MYKEILSVKVKLGILIWDFRDSDVHLEPASSGHWKNCRLWHLNMNLMLNPKAVPQSQVAMEKEAP